MLIYVHFVACQSFISATRWTRRLKLKGKKKGKECMLDGVYSKSKYRVLAALIKNYQEP